MFFPFFCGIHSKLAPCCPWVVNLVHFKMKRENPHKSSPFFSKPLIFGGSPGFQLIFMTPDSQLMSKASYFLILTASLVIIQKKILGVPIMVTL